MTIYGISGLGADERVFQHLTLSQEILPIPWIKPTKAESIQEYAQRIAKQITDETFILIAVSFGGLVAVELNKILKPKLTILISSADTNRGLRKIYSIIGSTGFLKFMPTFLFKPTKSLMYWLFGAKNKTLLSEILDDTDLDFTKWAIVELTTWTNTDKPSKLLKLHGTSDKLLPYRPDQDTIAIENGAHFMIVDKAEEISRILQKKIDDLLVLKNL